MASIEQENTIIKHRSSINRGDIFSWKLNFYRHITDISSDIFYFCGYCCYLKLTSDTNVQTQWQYNNALERFDTIISLRGYPSPCRKNISCQYSLFMKNDEIQFCFNKTGEIHAFEDVIDIELHRRRWNNNNSNVLPSTICFSWLENGDYEVLSQGTQTKPEISRNVSEQGTQTDEKWPSHILEFCSNSENETYKFLEILSKDLDNFYGDKTDPDCVLKVGENRFPVHRSVLSARSTVFAAMFHHDTSESRSGEVDIPDGDDQVFGDVLYYIYSGRIRGLSPDTASSMYIAADKYALIELREKCMAFLMLNLNLENVVDAAMVAHIHAEEQLENEIIQFIEENLEQLTVQENWIRFVDSHHKIANKLLCSALMNAKKK